MKRIFLISGFAIAILSGCGKDETLTPSANISLKLSKSNPKLGEPIVATISGSTAFSVSTSPAGSSRIITSGENAIVFFTTPGTAKLNVNSSAPTATASSDVTVVDEVYSPSGATADFSAGEAFTFTPISDGKGGFYFAVKTKKEYDGLNNAFEYDAEYIGAEKKFSINLKALAVPSLLVKGNGSANGFMFFKGPIANGTYDLQLCAGMSCYFGSLVVSDTDIKFNWTDTDVIVSPKTIAK